MTDIESRRLDQCNRLQEVLGTDPATTLMTFLPPVETTELLTRSEFDTEMGRVNVRLDRIDARFDRMEERFDYGLVKINKKIDRVLLAVVGGLFVILAAFFGGGALS